MKKEKKITLKNVSVHNLKNVDVELEIGKLIAFTGVSGSGKSSLAFDTLFIEGQKRYIDSLSKNAKRGLGKLPSPKAESISSLPPTVAIEQKTLSHNPRSTVGTITNLYDHLRLLFSHLATPFCPISGEKVSPSTEKEIDEAIFSLEDGEKLIFLAPFAKDKKGAFKDDLENLLKKGFIKVYIDKEFYDLSEDIPVLDKEKPHSIDLVIDRVVLNEKNSLRVKEAIAASLQAGDGVFSILLVKSNEEKIFSLFSYSPKSGLYYKTLESEDFSFNHPKGMCEKCKGIGVCEDFDLSLIIDENVSIKEGCCSIAPHFNTVRYGNIYKNLARMYKFSVSKPYKTLSKEAKQIFLYGTEDKWVKMNFTHPETGYRWSDYVEWKGVINIAKERINQSTTNIYKNKMRALMNIYPCTSCLGSRLKAYPSAAKFGNKTIAKWTALSIDELKEALEKIKLTKKQAMIAEEILKEMLTRISFLQDVGLSYLSLDRLSPTLSGGEAQRVRLSSLIGSSLTDILYILDEPSIGLHPKDNLKLIHTLKKLRDAGNTVIVVEHDEDTILSSDMVVDIGPKAGIEGGEVLYTGDLKGFKSQKTLTSDYIFGRKEIEVPKKRKISFDECIEIKGACHHNLKNVNVKVPLGVMTAITGISGSGKSSLISETLYPYLNNQLHKTTLFTGKHKKITGEQYIEKVVSIDQSPIGRTPRSNPATYVGVFTDIRKFFASLPAAKALGFSEGRFSFNVKEGSCSTCSGMGLTKVDMDFLADVWVTCSSCHGSRFTNDTLAITYKGKSINDVLNMPITEAATYFENLPQIHKKLSLLCSMGLGYITLGQSATTLSGGEAQRIKLCCELLKKKSTKTLYILDEPTTGLHFADIQKLLKILHSLVDAGNSIIVIEHNMDLVKTCDYVIDLGPEGGKNGGQILGQGTIEQVAKKTSPTAPFIKQALEKKKTTIQKTVKTSAQDCNRAIQIRGACEHNLKNLTLDIEKEQITIFTGPSGSGKSSLAYNTIFSEAQRRFVETLPPFSRRFIKALPKPKYRKIDSLPPVVAVEQKMRSMNPRSTLGTITEVYDHLRLIYTHLGKPYCPDTNFPIVEVDSGYIADQYDHIIKPTKIIVFAPINTKEIKDFDEWKETFLANGFLRIRLNGKMYELDEKVPYRRLMKNKLELVIDRIVYTKEHKKRLVNGIDLACKYSKDEVVLDVDGKSKYYNLSFSVKETGKSYPRITHRTFSFNHKEGMCEYCHGLGILIDVDEEIYSVFGSKSETICDGCNGGRLNSLASHVLVHGVSLPTLCNYSIEDFFTFVKNIQVSSKIKEPLKSIISATTFLCNLGLNYLSLSRMTRTLSDGEVQRMRLAKELHKDLTGACYILDEPTASLHPANNELLNKTLVDMKKRGNTIIIVEHDPLTMKIGDRLLDFGPKGGKAGGQIVASGSYAQLCKSKSSVTAPYLTGKKNLQRKTPFKEVKNFMDVENISIHNINNLSLSIPKEHITLFTGVSGAGKTSLVIDFLFKKLEENMQRRKPKKKIKTENGIIHDADYFAKVLRIDKTRVSYSSRSDVSTFLDILTPLRNFFAKLPDAVKQGLKAGAFSFNHKSGFCKRCKGHGHEEIDLQFLPPINVVCESCKGKRLNPLSLSIKYKGFSISELLALEVEEASKILPPIPKIHKALQILKDTGLEHLNLNRRVKTLSGGEGSRLKIAKELLQKDITPTLYIFDEPTAGLHFTDLELLLRLFDSLLLKGHCIWIIEHNTDIIKNGDYIIDLGPGGGIHGGTIIDQGSVKEICTRKKSLIARYLV